MKRLLIFLFPALLALGGCETALFGGPHYYRVVETDARGDLIAEWVALGGHTQDLEGYHIVAVERKAFNPPVRIRYPHGMPLTIAAAHVEFTRIDRPVWMDHYVESTSDLHEYRPK